jgi:hypothetical protein
VEGVWRQACDDVFLPMGGWERAVVADPCHSRGSLGH